MRRPPWTSLLPLLLLPLTQPACGGARCDDPAFVKSRGVEPGAHLEPAVTPESRPLDKLDLEGTIAHITLSMSEVGIAEIRIEVSGAHPGVLTGSLGSRPPLPLHEGDAIVAHFRCETNFHGRFCSGYITDPKGALLFATVIDGDELAPGFRCEASFVRCSTSGDRERAVRFVGPDGASATSDRRWEVLASQGVNYLVSGSASEVIDRSIPDSSDAKDCTLVRSSP